jgi:hypothetical protein
MAGKCANNWCSAPRTPSAGKLYRLDINLGKTTGGTERKTEYIWLCPRCAEVMRPKVDVAGDTVTLRLTKKLPEVAETNELRERAN